MAGLTAATYLARAGRSVVLFERSHEVGGQAVSQERSGFYFNLGPHALYRAGPGLKILSELGVEFTGGIPPAGGYALHEGALHRLPVSPWSLLTTSLFGFAAKLEAARFLSSLARVDAHAARHLSVSEWLETNVRRPALRQLLSALVRLTTYVNDPEHLSADVAIGQLQLAQQGSVYYLDRGWQVLVNGLRNAAEEAGVRTLTGVKVTAVLNDEAVRSVRLDDGTSHSTSAVILAVPPAAAAELVEGSEATPLGGWAAAAIPVRGATLDIGLSRLLQPRVRFVLGVDRPLYFSVHSGVADLAPEGGAMIHVSKYLSSDEEADSQSVEREFEDLLDLVQPGWREVLVERRFLPNIVVVTAMASAGQGGLSGRAGPEVPGIRNLYVAGDWVGPEGWLSDASRVSGKRAAELILGAGDGA